MASHSKQQRPGILHIAYIKSDVLRRIVVEIK